MRTGSARLPAIERESKIPRVQSEHTGAVQGSFTMGRCESLRTAFEYKNPSSVMSSLQAE